MLEFILAIILGTLAGTFTGISPGIHINLVSAFLISSLTNPAPSFSIFIISMAITHTFLDFIPSIYFNAPEEDSFLSILPGHKLLLKGEAHKAYLLTLYGSALSLIPFLLFIPIFLKSLNFIFPIFKIATPIILIFLSFYFILREDVINSFLIFFLSGILGKFTFSFLKEPFLPLLTGLFAIPSIIFSLKSSHIPKQKISTLKLTKQHLPNFLSSSLIAPICSFLPGIGSAHAAFISSEFTKSENESFLFSLGIINTLVMSLSFITLLSLNKTRTGAALAVKSISIPPIHQIILTILFSSILAFFIGKSISKFTAKNISRFSYKKINFSILILLLFLTFFISSIKGLLILFLASLIGIFSLKLNVRRIQLMGSLIIPTILIYLN